MKNQRIDKDHAFSAARAGGRLPFFLDFSIRLALGGVAFRQLLQQIITHFPHSYDGVIFSSDQLFEAETIFGKEIWVRGDDIEIFLTSNLGQNSLVKPRLAFRDWIREGVAGVVGTLLLGNSPEYEADNIQYLSSLRTQSRSVGLPMAIDLHVIHGKNIGNFTEVIEMGLNLIVELDGDLAIIPAGQHLVQNKNIHHIGVIPVFSRQSSTHDFLAGPLHEKWSPLSADIAGMVFTDLNMDYFSIRGDPPPKLEFNQTPVVGG